MGFEQLEHDPSAEVERFFQNNREQLKERTRAALEANDFKEGTLSFIKQVVGEIPEDEVFAYRKEVKKMISEVKKEKIEKEGREEDHKRQLVKDAEALEEQEEKRTGVHPEDYKEQ